MSKVNKNKHVIQQYGQKIPSWLVFQICNTCWIKLQEPRKMMLDAYIKLLNNIRSTHIRMFV